MSCKTTKEYNKDDFKVEKRTVHTDHICMSI